MSRAWASTSVALADARGYLYSIIEGGSPVSYFDILQLWSLDSRFRSFFNSLLESCPYREFRWETPTVTADTAQRAFEFALLNSPGLARTPEPEAFASHFGDNKPNPLAVAFPNLGGDAILIVPTPQVEDAAYGHIGAFVRSAPEVQQQAMWQLVGEQMSRRLNSRPVWLNTAGAGVSWLHVRLDDRPKYYGHAPYRKWE